MAHRKPNVSAISIWRSWHYHPAAGRFPLPTTEEWGEGKGEGIPISRANSMEGAPLSSPLARASQREGAGGFRDGSGFQVRPPPISRGISCCHHVDPIYTRQVRLNWKLLRLAIIPVFALLLCTGCSGINASGSVSPATFFLPGLGQVRPDAHRPETPPSALETNPLLARSH